MKNKLEVGMYVRTKKGIIDKIIDTTKEWHERGKDKEEKLYKIYQINQEIYDDEFDEYNDWVFANQFKKASHNIIDLIEVGDYVNGSKVTSKDQFLGFGNHDWYMLDNEIKSIVTKEQFESMEYRVGE